MYDPNFKMDISEFQRLMDEVTAKLKLMNQAQDNMRWQLGDQDTHFHEFVSELETTLHGWVSSNY